VRYMNLIIYFGVLRSIVVVDYGEVAIVSFKRKMALQTFKIKRRFLVHENY